MPQTPSMIERSNAEIAFDAGKQGCVFFRLLPAGDDAPVGDAAVEVLPELLVKFGLVAAFLKHGHVGMHGAHDGRVGRVRDAARDRLGAKGGDPPIERHARAFRAGGLRQHQSGNAAGDGL